MVSRAMIAVIFGFIFVRPSQSLAEENNCPIHFECLTVQDCPLSKELTRQIEVAREANDFGNLARYYGELSDIPKCGNGNVCCQLKQQGKIDGKCRRC